MVGRQLLAGDKLDGVDPTLVREEETHERCECHVCNTPRNLLCRQRGGRTRPPLPTPLLLTFGQAADLLGVSEGTCASWSESRDLSSGHRSVLRTVAHPPRRD